MPEQELTKLFEKKTPSKADFEPIIQLIKKGNLEVNAVDPNGMTLLIKVVMCPGDLEEIVIELIAQGANLTAGYIPTSNDLPLKTSPPSLPQTALSIAAAYGNLKCLKYLLPPNFNFERAQYRFAVNFAHKNKHNSCVHMLIAHHARLLMRGVGNNLISALNDGGIVGLTSLLDSGNLISQETIQEAVSKLKDAKTEFDWYMESRVFDLNIDEMIKPIENYREQHYPTLKPKHATGFFALFSCMSKPKADENEDTLAAGNPDLSASPSPN